MAHFKPFMFDCKSVYLHKTVNTCKSLCKKAESLVLGEEYDNCNIKTKAIQFTIIYRLCIHVLDTYLESSTICHCPWTLPVSIEFPPGPVTGHMPGLLYPQTTVIGVRPTRTERTVVHAPATRARSLEGSHGTTVDRGRGVRNVVPGQWVVWHREVGLGMAGMGAEPFLAACRLSVLAVGEDEEAEDEEQAG